MQRISELEKEWHSKLEICSLKIYKHLVDQAEISMSLAPESGRGPDLHNRFSVDTIINELTPDLYQLFQLVGDTARSSNKHGQLNLSLEEMKVIMSMHNSKC